MKAASLLSRILDRWPVKVLAVALAVVLYLLFRMNTLTERQIAVPLSVITPEGFIVSSDFPDRINMTMRGEADDVAGVLSEDVEAFVNLAPYPEEGEYRLPIEFRKTGTALLPEALELRSRPREIEVTLERRTVRSLVVRPELSGFPALGYDLTQYFVSPSSVTAVGPQSQMAGLTELKTEIIDLSGRLNDFSVTTRLVRPSNQILSPGGEVVEFRGVIDEAVVIRTIADREIVVIDLPDGLRIEGELPRVSLTVQGSQLTVEAARPQDMTFYIEGSEILNPGRYILPLMMDIPSGLAVLQVLPLEVEIRVAVDEAAGTPAAAGNGSAGSGNDLAETDSGEAEPFGTRVLPDYADTAGGSQ